MLITQLALQVLVLGDRLHSAQSRRKDDLDHSEEALEQLRVIQPGTKVSVTVSTRRLVNWFSFQIILVRKQRFSLQQAVKEVCI